MTRRPSLFFVNRFFWSTGETLYFNISNTIVSCSLSDTTPTFKKRGLNHVISNQFATSDSAGQTGAIFSDVFVSCANTAPPVYCG